MLTYDLTDIGSDTLYEHIYKCIRDDIMSDRLHAHDKLPSKRSFAKHLGVSNITVENAYAQLVAEGYLYALPKKGFYVAKMERWEPPSALKSSEEEQISVLSDFNWAADFTNNQTNSEYFPFSVWTKLMKEIMITQKDELMTPSPGSGIIELRQGIANHLKNFRNIHVSPERIIIGAGTEYLYSLLIQLFGTNQNYAVEDPGYQKISKVYTSYGAACLHIPMDEMGIELSALEQSNADIVHITPTHHFPTGIIMPVSRRYELLGWAASSDSRFIIEDEYDSEFRLNGKPIPALLSIDVMDKVIYMNTFAKSLSSTIRISYMILPQKLLERFKNQLSFYSCTVSNFEQYTLARFINDGYFERHMNRMRNLYRSRRDLVMKCIKNSPYANCIKITEANAGLHFLLHADIDKTGSEIVKKAAQKGLRVSSIAEYYYKVPKYDLPIFIINYSSLLEDSIEENIFLLCQCIFN